MSHKSKKSTLKRSTENFIMPQEQLSTSRKKPRAALETSTISLQTSQESSVEENTEELSTHEEELKNYNELLKNAATALKKIPAAFKSLLKEVKSQPKREVEKFVSYGICKKKGPNMGRIFSSEKILPDYKDVPKSFKWRDEITIMDLIPFHGTTQGGRAFIEMRTPDNRPIVGLREYQDEM